jgi:hypothetical protein
MTRYAYVCAVYDISCSCHKLHSMDIDSTFRDVHMPWNRKHKVGHWAAQHAGKWPDIHACVALV